MSKYVVGEICEVLAGSTNRWAECEILAIGCIPRGDYRIDVPTCTNPDGDTVWASWEIHMRKKRPPKQLDDKAADKEFTDELHDMLGLVRKPETETE